MVTTVVGVLVLLGGLIFFHELGHYLVAKAFGVTVEVFSLGFGKKIFRKKVGETEYCISIVPLGGYVKLMGDDPFKGVPAGQAERAFSTQKLYKRFLIVAAGPLANLLLAYVLFLGVFWAGKPVLGTQVGSVMAGTPAFEAGLRGKDRIRAVDGKAVSSWNEADEAFRSLEGKTVELSVDRNGKEMRIPVLVEKVEARSPYGEEIEVGGLKGVSPMASAPLIGVSDPKSPAYLAGLRTWDTITKIGTRAVLRFDELYEILDEEWQTGKPLIFTVKRPAEGSPEGLGKEMALTLTLPKKPQADKNPMGLTSALGIYPSEIFVYQITPNSPAAQAGFAPGDRVSRLDKAPVFDFESIVEKVQKAGGGQSTLVVELERAGNAVVLSMKPMEMTSEDPLTRQKVKSYVLGFRPQRAISESDITKVQVRGPIDLFKKAVDETILLTERNVVSLWKLAMGQISVKNLGGPVLIASVAGKSLDAGIIPFLQMMALISINLFLLNLFPVPVLDGGHLLFFAIEGLKGKPVSIRTMEIANQLGMVFILMLVGLTLFNDISRIVTR